MRSLSKHIEWQVIMLPLYLLCLVSVTSSTSIPHIHTSAQETEMFAIPISPNLFNWTYQEFDQQYRFHASLLGKPELPPWLRYIYSGRHHSGFIFGTPPRRTKQPITLEVIGLNRQDYETRRVLITLNIKPKDKMALHEVELKIDNLNVEDLLDEHRFSRFELDIMKLHLKDFRTLLINTAYIGMTRLKDILRTKLWVESNHDLYATFLASAIDMGARLPLKPEDGEGLVVRLGSTKPFSSELKRLREEVRPLSRLVTCPREYKRTTVERLFRDAGLTLDWCSFELYNTIYEEKTTLRLEYLTELPDSKKPLQKATDKHNVWTAPSRSDLPLRGYGRQMTMVIAIPFLLTVLTIGALTVAVCFHYATMRDEESDNFLDNIFHICIEYRNRRAHKSDKVEMCRYNTGNTEQTQVPDNTSNKSVSPNNSLVRPYSPKSTTNLAGNYNRPQPPPYVSSATNSLHHRKSTIDKTPSTSGHTPEHRTALEESLKLLNEANISTEFVKDPIIDINDGTDDYVPIKTDSTGYVSMKGADLDDIEVPDLTKFMGVGI